MGTQSVESVVGIQLLHVHLAMCHDVANEVDVAQIAYDIQLSVAPSFYVVHKAAAEVLYKLHAGSSCINTKIYIIALRRYIAGNEGLVFWTVICHSVDVNLLLLLIVAYIGVQYTQRSILKGELLDVQVSLCVRIVENAFYDSLARSSSGEVYRMEVDQVQNIRYVYILQVCHNRVFLVWSGEAVDDDVLLVVTYGKVIYL